MRIGEMLVRMGVLTRTQVDAVLTEQESSSEPFGAIAERLFSVSNEQIEHAWIEQTQERATLFDADRGVDEWKTLYSAGWKTLPRTQFDSAILA